MKDIKFQKAIQQIKNIKMTDAERKTVLERVLSAPALAKPVKSPWTVYSFSIWIKRNSWTVAMSVFVIIFLGSGGVLGAAKVSLPGSPLYALKVGFLEPLRATFTFTAKAKALYESGLADQRLVEAETLAANGQLDAPKQQQITGLLADNTAALNTALSDVQQADPSGQADDIAVDFQAGLSAHAKVLDAIASQSSLSDQADGTQIADAARTDLSLVAVPNIPSNVPHFNRGHRPPPSAPAVVPMSASSTASSTAIATTSASTTIQTPPPTRHFHHGMGQNMDMYDQKKASVQSLIDTTKADLDQVGTATTPIQDAIVNDTHQTLDQASQALDQADQQATSDPEASYSALLDSQRSAKEASIFLKAGMRFGKGNHGGGDDQ